jgi:hypothetical protein
MMKLVKLSIILMLAGLSYCAAEDVNAWQYYCDVSFEAGEKEYVKFEVTPDIYNRGQKHLPDLRLFDTSEKQVPYLIIHPWQQMKKTQFNPQILNRTTDQQKRSFLTLDFGDNKMKNYIEIDTKGSNFRRAVRIEGSNDNKDFFILVSEAFVFSIDKGKKSSVFSGINLPENDYRYLRVRVVPAEDDILAPEITEVRIYRRESIDTEPTTLTPRQTGHLEDSEQNVSIYDYDLGYMNLPISNIRLDITDKSFYRLVKVEARNQITQMVEIESEDNMIRYQEVEQNWIHISNSAIFRYLSEDEKIEENVSIPVSPESTKFRYLRLTIRNYDDLPLAVMGIEADILQEKVLFENPGASGIRVYVGSETAKKPRYDIEKKLEFPTKADAAIAKLSKLKKNPDYVPPQEVVPWSERYPILPLAIMVILVIVLGYFILKSMRTIKTGNSDAA